MIFKMFFSADEPCFRLMTSKGIHEAAAPIISICLMLFLLNSGCSQEEESLPPLQKPRVVKPIERPISEEAGTAQISEELKTKPEEKGGVETKTAAVEEKAPKEPQIEAETRETALAEEAGYYIAKKGDSLASIAGREDVYGDPMKWPILYRLNIEKFGHMRVGDDFVDKDLLEGMRLKIITPDEVKDNLEKRVNSPWVVNVLSSPRKAEIIPVADRLVREGYPVYITRAQVKGRDYMRIRVGFFEKKTVADMEGKKIRAILNLPDSWTIRVAKQEFQAFGGY